MLIDSYMPRYDVRERHRTNVAASPASTYAALRTTDVGAAPLVRALFALRALPGALAEGASGVRRILTHRRHSITVDSLEAEGFRVLEESPPTEIVLGAEGEFWRARGRLRTPPESAFRGQAPAPGTARGIINFWLRPRSDGTTELTTETRVQCADSTARRRFLPYWWLIRPASGIIRHAMLSAIRRAAEASTVDQQSSADG